MHTSMQEDEPHSAKTKATSSVFSTPTLSARLVAYVSPDDVKAVSAWETSASPNLPRTGSYAGRDSEYEWNILPPIFYVGPDVRAGVMYPRGMSPLPKMEPEKWSP